MPARRVLVVAWSSEESTLDLVGRQRTAGGAVVPLDLATLESAVRDHPAGVAVTLRVVPRAARTQIAGRHGDAIKLRVHAPPVDGAANTEVRRYLASRCGVPRSQVELLRGARSRDKLVLVRDAEPVAVRRALAAG